jgi:hypothetical protein
MWACTKCGRIFKKEKQPHSCNKIPLKEHFKNKEKAEELFNDLVEQINNKIGKCKIISLPCCIHLFGKYDFLALLPKKEGLEVRFSLNKKITKPRIKQTVPLSTVNFKNCLQISSEGDIDKELLEWLEESFHLKD